MIRLETIKETKGCTLNNVLETVSLNAGYAVSLPGHETIIEESDLSPAGLVELLEAYRKDLGSPSEFIGIWYNEGKFYFDISEVIQDKDKAIEHGRNRKQLAIFDFKASEVIQLD